MRRGLRVGALGAAFTAAAAGLVRLRRHRGSLGALGRQTRLCTTDIEDSRSDFFRVLAFCPKPFEDAVGEIEVEEFHGDWFIQNIDVDPGFQRRGVATMLYERAAEEVCDRGGPAIISDNRINEKSNNFWQKQVDKGRATVVHGDPQEIRGGDLVAIPCPAPRDLSRALAALRGMR